MLSDSQRAIFEDKGFIQLDGLFSAKEVRTWCEECRRLQRETDVSEEPDRVQWRDHQNGDPVADRFDPVVDISLTFNELASDCRILDSVEAALGGPVQLMKDKLIMKRPGTDGYGLHQDFPYWTCVGLRPDALLSVQVCIDPADESNGALEVFPRKHQRQLEGPPEEPRDVDESLVDPGQKEVIEAEAGSLLLFHSLVPHRSGANSSDRNRRTLYLTYAQTSDEDIYDRYYRMRPEY